jgi:hypothetical protein
MEFWIELAKSLINIATGQIGKTLETKRLLEAIKACIEIKKYAKAIELCEKVIELDPNNHEPYLFMGLIHLQSVEQYNQALDSLGAAIKRKPECYEAYLAKGDIFFKMSSYQKALSCYNKVLRVHCVDKLGISIHIKARVGCERCREKLQTRISIKFSSIRSNDLSISSESKKTRKNIQWSSDDT